MFIFALTLLAIQASAIWGKELHTCRRWQGIDLKCQPGEKCDYKIADDIKKWQDCRDLCEDDDGSTDDEGNVRATCYAWSWTKRALPNGAPANRCHLKDVTKVEKAISKEGVDSGIIGGCCAMKETDYFGHDGDMQENVSSWQECGASCQKTDGCKAWSWTREAVGDAPPHKCHHKTQALDDMNSSTEPAVISGDKDCVTDTIDTTYLEELMATNRTMTGEVQDRLRVRKKKCKGFWCRLKRG